MASSRSFSKTFYFFLILLVFIQEIKSRKYPIDLHRSVQNSKRSRSFERNKRAVRCFKDQTKCFNKNNDNGDETIISAPIHSRQKRSIALLVTGVTIAAMASSLVVEVVAYITKCCAYDKRTCNADTKINDGKKRLTDTSKRINLQYAQVQNQYTYIQNLNSKMQELWVRIQAIDDTVTNMITIIDPNVMNKLNQTQMTIQAKILANGKQYENFEELKAEYDSIFNNAFKIIYSYYGFVTTPIYFVAYRWVVNKIAAAGPGAFDHYRFYNPKKYILKSASWASSKYNTLSTKYPKTTKVITSAVSIIGGSVYLAFEAWKIYDTINRCKQFGDDVVKKLGVMEELETNTTNIYNDVNNLLTEVTENYVALKSQLMTADLFTYLTNVKELVRNSSTQFPEMNTALSKIDSFLNGISTADISGTDTLIEDLNHALQSVTVTMNCYRDQLAAVKYIVEECKKGSQSTLNQLFKEASVYTKCNTVGFITENNTVGMANSTLSSTDGVYSECIYNNDNLRKTVCLYKSYGLGIDFIATTIRITKEQATNFIAYHCP